MRRRGVAGAGGRDVLRAQRLRGEQGVQREGEAGEPGGGARRPRAASGAHGDGTWTACGERTGAQGGTP
ncbi:hypothetical protein ISF6_1860 [Piscinibacter sakaiensis]|uniref:Uncharacterized protein n=1 Tax=Piscinibacter sakaiensis TaxID=1547922 RepID=A0A0K8P1H3_PISS1|nr:hypothetical protein ISF6_1860 [Piscinibacter sakaiensis]